MLISTRTAFSIGARVFLLAFVFLVPVPSAAAPEQWTADGMLVCGGPDCSGRVPRICTDGAGGALIAWTLDHVSGTERDIYIQRVLSDGVLAPGWPLAGAPVVVAPRNQELLALAPDGVGGAFVAWSDRRDVFTTGVNVYAQHILGNGQIAAGWPANGLALSTAAGEQNFPDLLSDGAGGVFVAWEDRASVERLLAQHLTGSGTPVAGWPVGGLGLVVGTGASAVRPKLCADGHGGFLVTWADTRNNSSCADIFLQRITWAGAISAGWPANGKAVAHPDGRCPLTRGLAPDEIGGAYVAWAMSHQPTIQDDDVYAMRVLGDGSIAPGWPATGFPVAVFNGFQELTSVVADSAGGVMLAWHDHRDFPVVKAYVSRLRPNGALAPGWLPGGNEASDVYVYQFEPRLAPDGTGGAYVAFVDGVNNIGYVQHLTAGGTLAPGWPSSGIGLVDLLTAGQVDPAITPDQSGGAIVTWNDFRNGLQNQIYAQRYSGDGPTPVLVSLASVEALPDRVTLIWHRGEGTLSDVTIQRRREGEEWATIARAEFDGSGRVTFEDATVTPATRYAYRVTWTESGAEQFSAETWVDVPAAFTLMLEGAFPNPAVDALNVAFTLPREAPATLALFDVSGRQLASRDVGSLGAGRHLVRLDSPGRTPPGVYWLKLTQGEFALTRRAVVIR